MCGRVTLPTWEEMLAVAKSLGADAPAASEAELAALCSTGDDAGSPESRQATPGAMLPAFAARNGSEEDADSRILSGNTRSDSAHPDVAHPGTAFPDTAHPDAAFRNVALPASANHLQLAAFTWGYSAPWNGRLVYNTRIENASSPMWAESFSQRRALVAVAAFFEPHATETQRSPRTGRMGKRPYEFRSPDGAPLLLGAVHEAGMISIVTTRPNASVAPVHARMPLVLAPAEVPVWLGAQWRSLADRSRIELDAAPEHPDAESFEQLSLFT